MKTPSRKRRFFEWPAPLLRTECRKLTVAEGRSKVFRFGEGDDNAINGLCQKKQAVLADALSKYCDWQTGLGRGNLLPYWSEGMIPEKAAKGKGDGATVPDRNDSFLALLVCHLNNDSTFEGFIKRCQPKTQQDIDNKESSTESMFFDKLAGDMMNVDYRDDHNNKISFPRNHTLDSPPAPDDLFRALDDVDLGLATRELRSRYWDDRKPLKKALVKWLKDLASDHKDVTRKKKQSGGAGADDQSDGEEGASAGEDGAGLGPGDRNKKDAIHYWNFCAGKLPVMLYHDLMELKNASHYGDLVIPDGVAGMGSSIPGGPNHRGMGGDALEDLDSEKKARRRKKAAEDARRESREETKTQALLDAVSLLRSQVEHERKEQSDQAPAVDVADLLLTATAKLLAAKKALKNLDIDDVEEKAALELAVKIRKGEMKQIMDKHGLDT